MNTSFQPEITGVFPASFLLKLTGSDQLAKSSLNGTVAQHRTEFPNVLFVELTDFVLTCSSNHFKRGQLCFHKGNSLLEIFICGKDCSEQIFDERHDIFCSFVPPFLRFRKRVIVKVFVLCEFVMLFLRIWSNRLI